MNYIDPTGHQAQTVDIDSANQAITITWYIRFEGDGKSADAVRDIITGIRSYWEGTYQGWTVNINMRSGDDPSYDVINIVKDNPNATPSNVAGSARGTFYLIDENGNKADLKWLAAHEFGHFMGLGDEYESNSWIAQLFGPRRTWAKPGWQGNMMAEVGGTVSKTNVTMLLAANSTKLTGCVNDDFFKWYGGGSSIGGLARCASPSSGGANTIIRPGQPVP